MSKKGSRARPVAGGGRAAEVSAERLDGWFDRFASRNDGVVATCLGPAEVAVTAGNGTTVTAAVPFAPLAVIGDLAVTGDYDGLYVAPLVEHVRRSRRVGLVLVRLGGHSVGIAEGGTVVTSRTDRRLVHGRNSAGGWSQQRFARRRDEQAREALRAAASDAVEVVAARADELDGVVLGGDRRALDELRGDSRLAPLFERAEPRILDVAEPRRNVLDEAAARTRRVELIVRDG